jgi:hypothetical protein
LLYQTFVERTRAMIGICCISSLEENDDLFTNLLHCCQVQIPTIKQKNTPQELAFHMIALRTMMREQFASKINTAEAETQTDEPEQSKTEIPVEAKPKTPFSAHNNPKLLKVQQ